MDEDLDFKMPEKKRVVVVGTPERVISDNKISYKIPTKTFSENGEIGDTITYVTISEEDMTHMIDVAKHMSKDDEASRAYV